MLPVEEKLGKEVVKLMLDAARNGDISDSQLASIADKLGRDLGGGRTSSWVTISAEWKGTDLQQVILC